MKNSVELLQRVARGYIARKTIVKSLKLRNTLSKRWNGMIYIADDTAILDTSLEAVSAKKVRNKLNEN